MNTASILAAAVAPTSHPSEESTSHGNSSATHDFRQVLERIRADGHPEMASASHSDAGSSHAELSNNTVLKTNNDSNSVEGAAISNSSVDTASEIAAPVNSAIANHMATAHEASSGAILRPDQKMALNGTVTIQYPANRGAKTAQLTSRSNSDAKVKKNKTSIHGAGSTIVSGGASHLETTPIPKLPEAISNRKSNSQADTLADFPSEVVTDCSARNTPPLESAVSKYSGAGTSLTLGPSTLSPITSIGSIVTLTSDASHDVINAEPVPHIANTAAQSKASIGNSEADNNSFVGKPTVLPVSTHPSVESKSISRVASAPATASVGLGSPVIAKAKPKMQDATSSAKQEGSADLAWTPDNPGAHSNAGQPQDSIPSSFPVQSFGADSSSIDFSHNARDLSSLKTSTQFGHVRPQPDPQSGSTQETSVSPSLSSPQTSVSAHVTAATTAPVETVAASAQAAPSPIADAAQVASTMLASAPQHPASAPVDPRVHIQSSPIPDPPKMVDSGQLHMSSKGSELKISVQVPELGKVEVRAVTTHDVTTAHLTASNHDALQVLASDRAGLEQALKGRDVVLGSMDFNTHSQSSGQQQRQQNSPSPAQPNTSESTSVVTAPPSPGIETVSQGLLSDYSSISVRA